VAVPYLDLYDAHRVDATPIIGDHMLGDPEVAPGRVRWDQALVLVDEAAAAVKDDRP
jgi:hypothetical protein